MLITACSAWTRTSLHHYFIMHLDWHEESTYGICYLNCDAIELLSYFTHKSWDVLHDVSSRGQEVGSHYDMRALLAITRLDCVFDGRLSQLHMSNFNYVVVCVPLEKAREVLKGLVGRRLSAAMINQDHTYLAI